MKIADLFAKLSIRPDRKSFATADRLLGAVKGALAGIIAYKTVSFFVGMVHDTTELASKFVELSQKVGIGIEPLQQIGFAAEQSGVPLETLSGALGKFAMNAQAARDGGETQIKAFRKLGIDTTALTNGTLSLEDALGQAADTISKMPDGAQKGIAAMQVFGKSGREIIPLLNEGSVGINRLRQEFVDLGGQLDSETAKSLEDFGDQQDKIKVAMTGVRNQAVKALLPELKKLTAQFIAWWKNPANKAMVKRTLEKAFRFLISAIKMLVYVGEKVVKVMGWMGEHMGLVKATMIALVAMFAILKIAAIGSAIASAAAWVLASLPLILITALVLALILIVEDLWTWFRGGESVFKDLHEWAVDMFVDAIEFWVESFKDFFNWVVGKIEWVIDKIGAIPRAIKAAAKGVSSYFTGENSEDVVSPLGEQLKEEARRKKMAQVGAVSRSLNSGYFGSGELLQADHYKPEAPTYPGDKRAGAETNVTMGGVIVNVPPGTSTAEVGPVVQGAIREWWESKMRDFAADGA